MALADVDADMAERIAALGVTCDASYKGRELELPTEVRRVLGAFRFEQVMRGDRANPCEIARAAPPWLTAIPLDQLPLTVRLANVFRQSGLLTVADLAATKLNHLMKRQNFGRTSARHLVDILNTAIATGPAPPVVEAERYTGGTLLASVHTSLASLSERDGAIVRARMGLDCQPLTLVELGEVYGVTRERIRQIEERSIERLARAEVWDDVFTAKLQSLHAGRDHPLPLMGVEALDPWFAELGRQRNVARYLLRNLTTGGAALVEVDGVEYLSLIGQADWDTAMVEARAMLASVAAEGWTRAECRNHCDIVLPPEAREFATLLWDGASRLCHFSDETNMGVLIAYGRGAEQSVERILHLSNLPLHYSEIASRLAKEGKTVDERRVHNAAAAVGHLLGPGVYGLLKHIAVSRETMEAWAAEAADIVEAGPMGRQWHASELADEIGVRLGDPDVRKHLLDIALKQQGVLASLGRMIWTAADGSTDNARVEVRQAAIAILEAAGRPLSATELRQRLVAVRGLNIAMQVQVVDPIIKIDSRTFGLNDRDLDLKRDDQAAELGRLAAVLAKEAEPMPIGRCAALLGTLIPPRALSCLAAADPRLRVLPGGLVTVPSASINSATDHRKVAEEAEAPEPHSIYRVRRPIAAKTYVNRLRKFGFPARP